MKDEIYVCEECIKGLINACEQLKGIHSVLQNSGLDYERVAGLGSDLSEMSRKCENYIRLFDAHKRRLEEITIINDVYATPDIMHVDFPDEFN
ncbi:MAG: hypothetical protein J6K12_05940 [Clostridia bacterium]|nr:hypothetical protein [Clostridia bacterium]